MIWVLLTNNEPICCNSIEIWGHALIFKDKQTGMRRSENLVCVKAIAETLEELIHGD